MAEKRTIKVFIASPNDLAAERRAFKDQIEQLNLGFGDGAGVEFVPLGWEDALASTGRRPQSVINADVDACDVFILAMYRRWGQEAPESEFDSYTEEEFHLALKRWKRTKVPEILVFFKHVDAASMADPGDQLKKVLKFRKELERSNNVLYRHFEDESGFQTEVDKHLRAFARGELERRDTAADAVVLPIEARRAVEEAETSAKAAVEKHEQANEKAEAAMARAEQLALGMAQQAAKSADEGRLEEARQAFSMAIVGTTNIHILQLAFIFYERTGELSLAKELLERWLKTSGPDRRSADTANAYGNLGLIYKSRGDLKRAEAMTRKALEMHEKLGLREGMASAYGNLGLIHLTRGELEQAEAMHRRALAINEEMGRLEFVAGECVNLGHICQMRDELDQAEAMLVKALRIFKKIGSLHGQATSYGNLGLIYYIRRDFDRAEAMHCEALNIHKKLGRVDGVAQSSANLGLIHKARGDIDQAEALFRKALEIDKGLGNLEGIAAGFGSLGLIYKDRGDFDRAETMLRRALDIQEKVGSTDDMAASFDNLGIIHATRGDLGQAVSHWTKSRDLYARIGMPHQVEKVQGQIDGASSGSDDT